MRCMHAVLRLDGSNGSLDILAIYLHIGDSTPLEDAVEAGFDVRTALITIGLDVSHGHERIDLDAIRTASELGHLYLLSPILD